MISVRVGDLRACLARVWDYWSFLNFAVPDPLSPDRNYRRLLRRRTGALSTDFESEQSTSPSVEQVIRPPTPHPPSSPPPMEPSSEDASSVLKRLHQD